MKRSRTAVTDDHSVAAFPMRLLIRRDHPSQDSKVFFFLCGAAFKFRESAETISTVGAMPKERDFRRRNMGFEEEV